MGNIDPTATDGFRPSARRTLCVHFLELAYRYIDQNTSCIATFSLSARRGAIKMETTVKELADECIKTLHHCGLNANDEKTLAGIQNRLADFNLWCDGVGARAKPRASLDRRLQSRPDDLSMVKGMLSLLRQFLENYAKSLIENDGVEAPLRNVDSVLQNLALLAMAIRQTGKRSRLEKADSEYKPEDHTELRDHLEFILQLQGKEAGRKSTCLDWRQQRLVEANLMRRNRFVHAQKQAKILKSKHNSKIIHRAAAKFSPSQNAVEDKPTMQQAILRPSTSPTTRYSIDPVNPQHASESTISGRLASILDSKVKLGFPEPAWTPSGSEGPRTVITKITASTSYPRVHVPPEQQSFQCPCCCQILTRNYADNNNLWR